MIPKYSKEEKEAIGKGPYYLAVSAAQKCVRRGDINRAVNFAKVCWRMEPYRLFSRLWTILYEEAGRDIPALLAFYKYRGGYGDFQNLVPLIVALCQAQKSRDAACLGGILRGTTVVPLTLHEALKNNPIHKRVMDIYQAWPEKKFDAYDIWDFGVGDANLDWTVELAERSVTWDRDQFSAGSPYFFMTDTYEERRGYDEVPNIGPLWDGWFPLVAVDAHTRPGQIAMGTYIKHHGAKFGESTKGMGDYVFLQEGWKHRNHVKYAINFEHLAYSMAEGPDGGLNTQFVTDEATDHYQNTVLPELQGLRGWTLKKLFPEEIECLKQAYAEHWLAVEESLQPV